MNEVSVRPDGPGRYVVAGALQFDTVRQAREAGVEILAGGGPVTLDLQGVTRTDSAGLALLIEWMREAGRRNVQVHFENIPAQLKAIARVSRLERLLP